MFNSRYTRPFGKVMVMLFSLALLCVMSVGSPVASAQPVQQAAPAPHQSIAHKVHPHITVPSLPCTSSIGKYFDEFCFTPHVSIYCDAYTTNFDNNNQLINWSKVDPSKDCINITYNYTFALSTCDVYFYVPNGYGDTTIHFYLNGVKQNNTINESQYKSYTSQAIFSPTSSGSMSFDTNDTVGSAIGWGVATSDGLEEACYA